MKFQENIYVVFNVFVSLKVSDLDSYYISLSFPRYIVHCKF